MADNIQRETNEAYGCGNNSDCAVSCDGETNYECLTFVNISNYKSMTGKPLFVSATRQTCFSHMKNTKTVSLESRRLEKLQKRSAKFVELKIIQECLKRLVSAKSFAKKLEIYARHEHERLNKMLDGTDANDETLCLQYYQKLCEDAVKLHFNHWDMLESKIRRYYASFHECLNVVKKIKKFKMIFFSLRRRVLYWLRTIALVGVQVMANSSFKQLSSTTDVQTFLQGMETFNHIFTTCLRMCAEKQELFESPGKKACLKYFFYHSSFSLNIVEILGTVCVETAHLLARLTHEYLIKEEKAIELQDFLSVTQFSWTTDKHLSTSDLQECTANVSYGKLQCGVSKFVSKDDEFVKQLLHTASVCSYLHHEKENKQRNNSCQQHKQLIECDCLPPAKCWTCHESETSIKTITNTISDQSSHNSKHYTDPLPTINEKRMLFMESSANSPITQMCSIYSNDLWEQFALQFLNQLKKLQRPYLKDSVIGAVCCWSTAVLMGITQHLDNLAYTGPFSPIGAQSLRLVSSSLYLDSVTAGLDSFHCLMLAVGQTDKCKCTNIVDGTASIKTTNIMVQTCSIFVHFFTTALNWKVLKADGISLPCRTSETLFIRIEDVFDRFGAFLDYCIFWFTTKTKQFLANWNLSTYLLLSKYELRVIIKSINTVLQCMEVLLCGTGHNWTENLRKYSEDLERKAGIIQMIEIECWENFKRKFITMASDFWQEMMPKGRVWKRSRGSANLPNEPSSYVEHAIVQVLQPIIEGAKLLPSRLQNYILVQAVEIMMDTWSSHILKEKIKFSVVGAHQLEVDFNYIKLWLTSEMSTLCASVQSELAILDVFRHLNEAVQLLMIQPKKKVFPVARNGVQQEISSNSSTISGSSALSTNSSYDGELEMLGHRLIPNKDQWLNLRLRKGKPRVPNVIPSCLKSPEHT